MRIALSVPSGITAYVTTALSGSLFLLLLFPASTAAQAPLPADQIRALENSVRIAAEQRAPAGQLGLLWHSLALQYHYRFEFDQAGNAYSHAIPLLRDTGSRTEYADSLKGAGEIAVIQLRTKQGLTNLFEALAVFQQLGDTPGIAGVRDTIAIALVREHKYREAEAEATETLKLLQTIQNPDPSEVEAAYLSRARALAGEGDAGAALQDVARARAMQPESSEAGRIAAMAVLIVEGEISIQSGREAEGRNSMKRAVEIAQSRTDISPAASLALQASILNREAVMLRKAHLRQDAKLVEEQVKQLQSAAPAGCTACTVPVTSLLPQ